MERQIDSSSLRTGHVIRAIYEPEGNDQVADKQIFWIRGNNRERDVLKRILRVEDQFGRPSEIPVLDILEGRWGSYCIEGVYSPKELGLKDPRILNSNGKGGDESVVDTIDDRLEPIKLSKLGPNIRLRVSSVGLNDMEVDTFRIRITGELTENGGKIFVLEDEFGNSYDVPEADVRRGRYDGWMRFDGIIPKKENGGVDPFGSTQGQS